MKFSEFLKYRPKSVPNVLVFICEDDFLVEESRSVWGDLLGPSWVFERLQPKEFDELEPARLLEDAQTPSLFSQSRLLFVSNAEKVPKRRSEDLKALQEVHSSSLKVILISPSAKSAEAWSKTFPSIAIDPLKPADVARWLIERYELSADVARYVVDSAGTELYPLHNEMQKLKTYLGGEGPVRIEDVEASILRAEKFGPFELDDAILERNYRKAVSVIGAMLDDGVEPLLILGKMARVWRQLFVGKGLAGRKSAQELASAAGVPAFKAASFAGHCRRYSWPQLVAGFRELLSADRAFKTSSPNPEAYFDILLWKLVG